HARVELQALGHKRAPGRAHDAGERPDVQAGQVPSRGRLHARLHEVHPEPREVRRLRRRAVPIPRCGRAGTVHAGGGRRQRGEGAARSAGRRPHRQIAEVARIEEITLPRERRTAARWRWSATALLFMGPAMVLVLVFFIAPVVITFAMSFTDLATSTGLSHWQWIGPDNYARIFRSQF